MNKQNEDSMAVKQAYIRQHIPENKYEQFYEFCEAEASNMDIESWSMSFVKDLVQKFMKNQADRENSNKKKEHQPFFAYQTGNANQLKDLRQQIKEEKNKISQQLQSQKIKTPEKPKQKTQQSALELLDSIFSNNPNNNINESQFESKKYDKSFFQSCNFWGAPVEDNRKETQGSPSGTSKSNVSYANNFKPVEIPNFDKVFQTGMNLSQIKPEIRQAKVQIKPQKIEKKQQQSRDSKINNNVVKSRQWKLQEIPIEDDDTTKIPTKSNQSRPIQKKDERKKEAQPKNEIKHSVKLTSIKSIKAPKVSYTGQILIKQPFNGTVACFKSLQRMNFSSQKLKVTIQSYETITRSFFSSNYIMYHLRVMPANIICKRNLQDFQKLKNNLQGVYPGIRLPYLEKPGWLQSETTPEFVQKQKKYLTFFLEDIFSHPQLRNSRILQDFLTLKDHKSIKRKFQEYQKIKKVTSIQQLCLMQGEVKVQISEQNRQYNEYLTGFLTKMNTFWDSQQKILTQISTMYDGLVDNYQRWMQAVQQIQKQIKQFNKRVCFNQLVTIQSAFKDLSKYIIECSNFNLNEKQFLQNNIFPLFRFEKQNMNLLNNIMTVQDTLTRTYLKRKDAEKSQDNVEYLSDRLKDYKINILQESGSITVLKYQCGYTSELAVSEGYRYFDRLSQKVVNLISEVCKGKLAKFSQSINTMTELVNA